MLWQAGKGALMAKIDVANAFRNVPVHPDDRHLLGMVWRDKFYLMCYLMHMLMHWNGLYGLMGARIYYITLMIFLVVGRPTTDECSKYLEILISTFTMLAVPLAEDKIEGPETRLTFLGIEIDIQKGK